MTTTIGAARPLDRITRIMPNRRGLIGHSFRAAIRAYDPLLRLLKARARLLRVLDERHSSDWPRCRRFELVSGVLLLAGQRVDECG